ncbi:hypothetical protein CRG98_004535 [Punica granatum]|uniref:Uncharacterized protein n=1 Tax=Punica granatum TaxID=22663 RepID=A0A2I0L2X6_PUNGR|nr:hypothetical protein CRG98_004535 [Punica granatum]
MTIGECLENVILTENFTVFTSFDLHLHRAVVLKADFDPFSVTTNHFKIVEEEGQKGSGCPTSPITVLERSSTTPEVTNNLDQAMMVCVRPLTIKSSSSLFLMKERERRRRAKDASATTEPIEMVAGVGKSPCQLRLLVTSGVGDNLARSVVTEVGAITTPCYCSSIAKVDFKI